MHISWYTPDDFSRELEESFGVSLGSGGELPPAIFNSGSAGTAAVAAVAGSSGASLVSAPGRGGVPSAEEPVAVVAAVLADVVDSVVAAAWLPAVAKPPIAKLTLLNASSRSNRSSIDTGESATSEPDSTGRASDSDVDEDSGSGSGSGEESDADDGKCTSNLSFSLQTQRLSMIAVISPAPAEADCSVRWWHSPLDGGWGSEAEPPLGRPRTSLLSLGATSWRPCCPPPRRAGPRCPSSLQKCRAAAFG